MKNFKTIFVLAAAALLMSVGYAEEAKKHDQKPAPVVAYVVSGSAISFRAFTDLQAAFDAAHKGDTVHIMAGSYPAIDIHGGLAKVQRMEGSEGAIVINGLPFEGVMLAGHCRKNVAMIAKK